MNKRYRHLQGLEASGRRPIIPREVRTPLLVMAGLIGVPLAISLANRDDDEGDDPPLPTVDQNTPYPMNHHLPGAGYYHAPFHAWFPLPYNSHEPTRGWYRGGQWRMNPLEDENEQHEQQRSGFAARSSSSGVVRGTFPTATAVQQANSSAATHHANTISRGGFGSSARPGYS